LAAHHIPFIRFFAGSGYPVDAQKLYAVDRERYWREMDALFKLCWDRNIRLIPSLGILGPWADYHGEHKRAILDPASKTYASTYGYVREFVTRYRHDPVVLMWELNNEIFHIADLNFSGKPPKRPAGVFLPGTPGHRRELRTLDDCFSTDMFITLCRDMTRFIKDLDPNHVVTTGDAAPRHCSRALRENFPKHVWTPDTIEEHCSSLLMQQARPLDVISLHVYGKTGARIKVDNLPVLEYAKALVRTGIANGRPVYVGEFGQGRGAFLKDDQQAAWFLNPFDLFEEEGVSLITLWVVHFPWQNKNFNIANCAGHPAVFERIRRFNDTHAKPLYENGL
ncbi:MAG: cellulase family glycosylhydrolase, partial [Lentisphaerae bacterium]|nr:cellulase family glycosylhydrolase [Lentisphaerota bacterium]